MNFLDDKLEQYIENHSGKEDEVLYQLYRETHLKVMHPRMLSGWTQGQFLQMLASMIQAESILEIGTYTGYSAICLARGMKEEGQLITIDIKEELESIAKKYFRKAGLDKKIEQRIGDALEIIPSLNQQFDLVFIDADKQNYPVYLDLVIDKIKSGGLLIADNVLWSGKVVEELKHDDRDTPAVLKFNKKVQDHPQLQNVLLPLRDGLMLAQKL
jgi:predicted O-methyltransferase YrrM